MANQTISADTNHDVATGRNAGEDFTINSGAVLTIDSMPHLTAMGILGDITLSDGTLRIDGTRTYELAYSSGTGTLPAILDVISWNGGADTGKVVRKNSGVAAAGVLTLTMDAGSTPPAAADTLVSGGWSATADSSKFGYLIVYGEDQDWGSVDARSSFIVTGEWYELGVGTGADAQVLTLPHAGHQPAVWVETGNGTDVFEIWHRVNPAGDAAFFDPDDFGNTFESGFVFSQIFGTSTVTFGTSTAGGVPPSGARIRIPNVHIGTTSVGSPATEVNSAVLLNHITLVPANTNMNVSIDHLNASSCGLDFRSTNAVVVEDSCWGMCTLNTLITKVNAEVRLSRCCFAPGSPADYAASPLTTAGIIDNIGGVIFDSCVFYGGRNTTNSGALLITTTTNVGFIGVCKGVSNQQDENTAAVLRYSGALRITAETLILLNGHLLTSAGSFDLEIDELIYGLAPGRGTTEENILTAVSATASNNITIRSGDWPRGALSTGPPTSTRSPTATTCGSSTTVR